jgi:nitrogen fixation NifU-like protein
MGLLDRMLALRAGKKQGSTTAFSFIEFGIGAFMSDLRELYQEVILDHHKKPRNFRKLENATQEMHGHNPLCGDKVTVYVRLEDGVVKDVSFQGSGCAISTASASMMTESLKGKTLAEVEELFQAFHELVTGQHPPSTSKEGTGAVKAPPLGKLAVFSGVREFPVRVKCATLAWHTLRAALKGDRQMVSTE